jgi:RNA polymerase sigma-B factor
MQVGYVGLLKAINNFDPAAGASLATYARPCINGEIKRHFRDKRWQVRVKRPVQELVLEVRKATWRLAQELGHTPTESDLARHLGSAGMTCGRPGGRSWPSGHTHWTCRWPVSPA